MSAMVHRINFDEIQQAFKDYYVSSLKYPLVSFNFKSRSIFWQ